jgi:uncharacterized protein (UPF0261 family)
VAQERAETKTVAIIGTLDTKGEEIMFLKTLIEEEGIRTIVIDMGTYQSSLPADVTNEEVARLGGVELEDIRARKFPRNKVTDIMSKGVIKHVGQLLAEGELGGIVSLGGASATDMATRVMKGLPFGVPKLMVSSAAAMPQYAAGYFGSTDLIMFSSVIDIAGLNILTRNILSRAAGAICGLVKAGGGSIMPMLQERGKQQPLVAVTGFAYSEKCTQCVANRLKGLGYEVIRVHAQGIGDRAMEEMIRQGIFGGVVDIVPAGVSEELLGGNRASGPGRLEAAGERGIPQVVTPCGFEMISCGPLERKDKNDPLWVSRNLASRRLYVHDAFRVQAKTLPEELRLIARVVADKLNNAKGPVRFLIPLKGWSSLSVEGGPLHDPEADNVFVRELKKHLKAKNVEIDASLVSPEFGESVVRAFDELMKLHALEARTRHENEFEAES